jgi:hypothetical protein
MKAQFFLLLITFNGLLLYANSASASVATPESQVTHLSKTIANLIDFDDRNLVAQAINRALLAQNSKEDNSPPQIAGDIQIITPQPIINGRIANPKPEPTRGEGRPRRLPPQNPPITTPTNDPPVIINGLIRNDR